ncbi:DUF1876 domain-containing protein [Frankia sp. CNm7]|uniref:DUF1876 domain-containing protein n=1 Tax=Frankia nepalensis TaxID=1836974 RepID=A0A937URI8_9ACTN|nr:DUF1876 domain-containing protein [Frankia nepalensis]MBL7494916.1 DUF1876 domain-containing protein [Frankia nepalensis]MBL7514436.1 DUF1876 domain-containing protein [Frankia nepalensis]MBL7524833.1 DUF1876 domain-containing protein [Frankia nepalensis]MBL7632909.1 DUF1876 domain-containing protein [Frankia nepalensis]
MTTTRTWTVDVLLTEDGGRTRAQALLNGAEEGRVAVAGTELRAEGMARCHPDDADVSMIGDEVAASRALSELAHQLLDSAARDIEARTGRKAHVSP